MTRTCREIEPPLDGAALTLLSHSMYRPEGVRERARLLEEERARFFACFEGGRALGLLVLSLGGGGRAEIRAVASAEEARGRGVGRELVSFAAGALGLSELEAETDSDAVGFYRRLGFEIVSLGEKYPGTERFQCTLHIAAESI